MLSARSCIWVGATPDTNTGWGDEGIESSPEEKVLGVLIEVKSDMSHQCVLTV